MLNENSLVTVYVTNYNYAAYIETAINSVLNQSYKSIELIVIDDGSSDESPHLIEKLATIHGFRYRICENSGLHAANNLALSLANGEFIIRLDADDWLDARCVEVMVNELVANPAAALVFPDYYLVDALGNKLSRVRRFDFSKATILNAPAHGACTMFRTSILREVGGYDETYTRQDGVFIWLKIIENYKVANINEPLFFYRQHGSNLTNDSLRLHATRAEIFHQHVKLKGEDIAELFVIPIRKRFVPGGIDLLQPYIEGKSLLEILVNKALDSQSISRVIICSEDSEIEAFASTKLANVATFIRRPDHYGSENKSVVGTLNFIIASLRESKSLMKERVVVCCDPSYVFTSSIYIDLCVYNLLTFSLDGVDTVIEDYSIMYRPTESGLIATNDVSFIKNERDTLYKRTGGLSAYSIASLREDFSIFNAKMGHVEVDKYATAHLGFFPSLAAVKSYIEEIQNAE